MTTDVSNSPSAVGDNAAQPYILRLLAMHSRANDMDITAIVFDVGGVIARQDRAAADRELADRWPGVTSQFVSEARNSPDLVELWAEHSCGRVAPDDYWAAILEHLGVALTVSAVEDMRGIQRRTLWSVIDERVLGMACAVHADDRLRAGVLSNSAVDYEPHIARFDLCFEEMRFSHLTGVRKPDPTAYVDVAAALGSALGQTVFIDDKERNTVAAEKLGMPAILFTDAPSLARDLAALGVSVGP